MTVALTMSYKLISF